MQIKSILNNKNFLPTLIFSCGAVPFLFSIVAEYGFKLIPCHLCLYQRYIYLALAFSGLLVFFINKKPLLLLSPLLLALSLGVATYHSSVERGIIAGPSGCSGNISDGASLDEIREQILSAELVRCDQPAFTLYGFSMADANIALSLILLILISALCWRGGKINNA